MMYDKLKKAFFKAIQQGDLLRVALLVRKAPKEFYSAYSPLVTAVRRERLEIVEFLLQEKVDSNHLDEAVFWASRDGRTIKLLEMLIEAGANLNVIVNGLSPLSDLCKLGEIEKLKLLLDAGADPNLRESGDWTAIMYAAYEGHRNIVQLLIEAGADINAQNTYGATALMYASLQGHIEIIQLLLEAGADPDIHDTCDKTAAYYADKRGFSDIAQLLMAHQVA